LQVEEQLKAMKVNNMAKALHFFRKRRQGQSSKKQIWPG